MAHLLEFALSHRYNDADVGIGIPVTLSSGGEQIDLVAKVDTGAQYCIFERAYGERLGLDIERGHPVQMSSATGHSFLTFGHEVNLEVLGCPFASTVYFAGDQNFPSRL